MNYFQYFQQVVSHNNLANLEGIGSAIKQKQVIDEVLSG